MHFVDYSKPLNVLGVVDLRLESNAICKLMLHSVIYIFFFCFCKLLLASCSNNNSIGNNVNKTPIKQYLKIVIQEQLIEYFFTKTVYILRLKNLWIYAVILP